MEYSCFDGKQNYCSNIQHIPCLLLSIQTSCLFSIRTHLRLLISFILLAHINGMSACNQLHHFITHFRSTKLKRLHFICIHALLRECSMLICTNPFLFTLSGCIFVSMLQGVSQRRHAWFDGIYAHIAHTYNYIRVHIICVYCYCVQLASTFICHFR